MKYLLVLVILCLLTVPLMAEEGKKQEKPAEEKVIAFLYFTGGYVISFLDIPKMSQKEVKNFIALVSFYKAMTGKKIDLRLMLALNKKMLPKWTKRMVKKVEKPEVKKEAVK